MIESFKDHPILNEIEEEDSLLRKLLTNKSTVNVKGTFHIPFLMLIGLLYCNSDLDNKVIKFF